MKIKELIKVLEGKGKDDEVQCIIVRDDGLMVAVELNNGKHVDLMNILKLFKKHTVRK